MTHCHCSMCRKTHGAPFVTWLEAPAAGFRWTAGEAGIRHYASSAVLTRAFCPRCGSALPNFDGDTAYVPAGCLDDDPGVRPEQHIFFASRAAWLTIADDLPRHDAEPGAPPLPAAAPRVAGDAEPGTLRGSCQCNTVRYVVVEPFKAVYHCHCRRCRKARAAAHTSNGFVSADGVRLVAGEDSIDTYRLPEAKFFAHAFCRTCGSGAPRVNRERGVASLPFGTLDDDPGRDADCHIHLASRAPWYSPGDDGLPRFDGMPPPGA